MGLTKLYNNRMIQFSSEIGKHFLKNEMPMAKKTHEIRITNHQEDENKNHSEVTSHPSWNS